MTQQKITAVKTEWPYILDAHWANGRQTRVDIAEYLDLPGYERLKEPAFFAAAVEEWGHGAIGANGDIGADALYRFGKEQVGAAFPVSE